MKKIVCLVLALVLALGLCVSAFAADANGTSPDITVTIIEGSTKVYGVNVAWTQPLEYTRKWNPANQTFTNDGGSWTIPETTVTVTNLSNAAVEYTATFNDAGDDGMNADITAGEAGDLTAWAESGNEHIATITVRANGAPNNNIPAGEGAIIGTVGVSITAA